MNPSWGTGETQGQGEDNTQQNAAGASGVSLVAELCAQILVWGFPFLDSCIQAESSTKQTAIPLASALALHTQHWGVFGSVPVGEGSSLLQVASFHKTNTFSPTPLRAQRKNLTFPWATQFHEFSYYLVGDPECFIYHVDTFTVRFEIRVLFSPIRSLKLQLWMYWQHHPALSLAFSHDEMRPLHSGHSAYLLQLVDYLLLPPSDMTPINGLLWMWQTETWVRAHFDLKDFFLFLFFLAQAREFSAC